MFWHLSVSYDTLLYLSYPFLFLVTTLCQRLAPYTLGISHGFLAGNDKLRLTVHKNSRVKLGAS